MSETVYRSDRWGKLANAETFADAARTLGAIARHPSEVAARKVYLDLLHLRPGQCVLEVGAGSGAVALDTARRVTPSGTITALDPFQPLLDMAVAEATSAGLGANLKTQCGDARDLPFTDRSFDAAYCHWLLIHVAPAARIIREMMRVTKPGGGVLCVEADWETATVHPGDPAVTRRILNACCARQLDGWMGRKLRGTMRACGLADVAAHPIVSIDDGGERSGWLDHVRSRADVALEANAISAAERTAWLAALDDGGARGDYFFSVTQFATIGTMP
jgi:ubiquinone/menaquinone biosynthesis C-methylase UbiE